MRIGNTWKNSTLSGNFLVVVATILSTLMIAASSSPMPSSLSSAAFAQEEDDWGLIGNLISQQQSPQAYARNVNEDNKVIIVENCEDGEVIINDNDQIIQTNTQSFNQEANNQVGEEDEEEEEG
jgi:hypothetical protein